MRFVIASCAAAVLLLAAGCDGTGPGCDVCSTSAEVSGRVTDAAGSPVAGAAVAIEVYADSCAGPPRIPVPGGEPWVLRTSEAGEYADRIRTGSAPFTACLIVRVTPP